MIPSSQLQFCSSTNTSPPHQATRRKLKDIIFFCKVMQNNTLHSYQCLGYQKAFYTLFCGASSFFVILIALWTFSLSLLLLASSILRLHPALQAPTQQSFCPAMYQRSGGQEHILHYLFQSLAVVWWHNPSILFAPFSCFQLHSYQYWKWRIFCRAQANHLLWCLDDSSR